MDKADIACIASFIGLGFGYFLGVTTENTRWEHKLVNAGVASYTVDNKGNVSFKLKEVNNVED